MKERKEVGEEVEEVEEKKEQRRKPLLHEREDLREAIWLFV
jgi:hypothetical protein